MVDAYSKKIWTQCMNTDTTTSKTLAVLYGWFCSETGLSHSLDVLHIGVVLFHFLFNISISIKDKYTKL